MRLNTKHMRDELGNLAVALFLNGQFIRSILRVYIPGFTQHGIRFVFTVSTVLMILSIRKIRLSFWGYFAPALILFYYTMTEIFFRGKCAVSVYELLNYAILPFLFVQLDIDFERIIKYTLIITSPAVFVAEKIFVHYSEQAITMLLSYSVLFSVICALAYLLHYWKRDDRKSIIYLILCGIQFYFLYEMISYGSRGPILSVAAFLIIMFFFKPDISEKRTVSQQNRYRYSFIILSIVFITISMNSEEIIRLLYEFAQRHNMFIRSLEKTYFLIQTDNISHGRTDIYLLAIKGFGQSPLWGNGLDMFYANTNVVYPHNILLQLAYDGGLILLLFMLIPVILASIKMLKMNALGLFVPWAILFCSSVPGGMFSGDLWKKYTYWFFVAYCLNYKAFRKHLLVKNNSCLTEETNKGYF